MTTTLTQSSIVIVAGEGEMGTVTTYTGKDSPLAIKRRLAAERCDGQRWAKAIRYSHTNDHGHVGENIETGEYCHFPLPDAQ